MARRWMTVVGLVAIAAGLLATTVQAGGWATVTLDEPIAEPRAGEMIAVGFTVKQHDVTPIHRVGGSGPAVVAVFTALHEQSGERITASATPTAGVVGHFDVQISFPKAGRWLPEITPTPFAGTKLSPVNVLTATGERASASAADEASIVQAASATATTATTANGRTRDTLLAVGLVAAALAVSGALAFGKGGMLARR